jgi:hypothetical protein
MNWNDVKADLDPHWKEIKDDLNAVRVNGEAFETLRRAVAELDVERDSWIWQVELIQAVVAAARVLVKEAQP